MKNLILLLSAIIFSSPAFANHWSLKCDFGDKGITLRINNNKAKLIAPFGTTVFEFSREYSDSKIYTAVEGQNGTLETPNADYVIGAIPMGAKAEFLFNPGVALAEPMPLTCETRPTLLPDQDLF